MDKRLYIIIAIFILSFPCLAYGEIAHSFPLSGDTISSHGDMHIEPAIQAPNTNGWQKNKDISFESSLAITIDIHHFPYKHSFNRDVLAIARLFLTPYFYEGGYLSFTVI